MTLRKRVLLELLKKGQVKRKQLLDSLGIAKSTLSYVIRDLRAEGKIEIVSERRGRGRPSERIRISPKAWEVIGIKLGREGVIGILMDATLREIKRVEEKVPHGARNLEGYSLLLQKVLDSLVRKRAVAIGVSVSGSVSNGIVVDSPMLNINNMDIKTMIEERFKGPISVMGDVQALAVYESFKYGGQRFLIVNYGLGIGACWCENGKSHSLPIGHTLVVRNGEKCYCGQKGCLETVASDYTNLKAFTGKNFSIIEFVEYEHERYEKYLRKMWEIAQKNHEKLLPIYNRSIEMLSTVIGNLLVLLQPHKISFYGEGIFQWMVEKIEGKIKESFTRSGIKEIKFYCRKESDAFEKGAAFRSVLEYLRK